ncbi:MAG: gamma-glutamyltransferase [Alphaproteobacteria bacterium]|nr:gamma-glutamyltransferase [Alphaproteobacteria bacterium]
MASERAEVVATRHMAVAGHQLAASAAFSVLEAGGNAIDAGVAGGLALGILESDLVSVAGVAPIMVYSAETQQVVTISGLGWWPKAADIEHFRREYGGAIPNGVLRTVVPAAPDAWITALELWGRMSFGEVASAAIRYARDGFPMYPLMERIISEHEAEFRAAPDTAAIFLPGGRPPRTGELFFQKEGAAALQYMADEEAAAARRGGRKAGLAAARDAFYKGDIARRIAEWQATEGGWMTREDLASFRVGIEEPVRGRFGNADVYACGPWCQGPALIEVLNIVGGYDLGALGHNSADAVHVSVEAVKLAMADRDAWLGDPRFVDVPIDTLASEAYAALRRAEIDMGRAMPEMPPPGDAGSRRSVPAAPVPTREPEVAPLDTSYVCVVDEEGNVFSATPSDGSYGGTVAPGVGLAISSRGCQSWTDPAHASALAPGKRPRLTPNPALAVLDGGTRFVPFGTPGGDVQTQAMSQCLMNLAVHGMSAQEAVSAPRYASYSFPSSFEPHAYYPGLLKLEGAIADEAGDELARRGHEIERWPERIWLAGSVCMIDANSERGVMTGGADPRRMACAVGA